MIARLRGWRLALLCAAVLLMVAGVAVVLAGDDGNEPDRVAARATTTSSSTSATSTTASSTSTTVAPTTTTAVKAAPAPVTTAAPRPAPAACPAPAPGSDFDGFGATEIVIADGAGSHRSCVLTADTSRQQARGLMNQDDIDTYAGMIFRFTKAEEQSFWMRNTRIPLSIAFFDAGGAFVSSADMEPCGDRSDCPTYPSGGAAKFALEVLKGQLPGVGATPGSRLAG